VRKKILGRTEQLSKQIYWFQKPTEWITAKRVDCTINSEFLSYREVQLSFDGIGNNATYHREKLM
jgi:hypothetical protein